MNNGILWAVPKKKVTHRTKRIRVVTQFQKPQNNLNYCSTLQAGARVDLPMWLGVSLAKREVVQLKNPKILSKEFFGQLNAGQEVVTMRTLTPYVYENVVKLSSCLEERSARDAILLFQTTFIKRFGSLVIPHSQNFTSANYEAEDFSGLVEKRLSNLEREIFQTHR